MRKVLNLNFQFKREGSQKDTESAKVSDKERRTERGMEKVESG